MHNHQVDIVVYQEDSAYVAQCLNIDVASEGDTAKEALANVREALELYFDDEQQSDVPEVSHVKVAKLTLQGA